ncbi:hypothetical protein B1F79_02275 [Coxiella-like endosymbiont of Rhipicephalus sanguineus]|nr:hypothetical protein [Coxiella-like endosymbiont of Rhipicephalus sanguineus]
MVFITDEWFGIGAVIIGAMSFCCGLFFYFSIVGRLAFALTDKMIDMPIKLSEAEKKIFPSKVFRIAQIF